MTVDREQIMRDAAHVITIGAQRMEATLAQHCFALLEELDEAEDDRALTWLDRGWMVLGVVAFFSLAVVLIGTLIAIGVLTYQALTGSA